MNIVKATNTLYNFLEKYRLFSLITDNYYDKSNIISICSYLIIEANKRIILIPPSNDTKSTEYITYKTPEIEDLMSILIDIGDIHFKSYIKQLSTKKLLALWDQEMLIIANKNKHCNSIW